MLLPVILTNSLFFLILVNLPLTITDLNSDTAALLNFSNGLPRIGNKLNNWNQQHSVCNWTGISCRRLTTGDRVTRISLPAVGLYGPIVANSIGKLDALETLSLRSNLLYGNIPPDIFSISTLRAIYLQNNSFCGDIPRFKTWPPYLRIVDLSFNSFTGNIPHVLTNLRQLMCLSLQNNSFSGNIPDLNLKGFPRRQVNMSCNNGSIPYLNLSYNKLDGLIPYLLQNFSVYSFIGNPMLCGKPLNDCSSLPPAPPPYSIAACSVKVGAIPIVAFTILFLLV